MKLVEMVKKRSKHHALCDIIDFHFETKRWKQHQFYNITKEEEHYFMQRISVKTYAPIQGECDVAAIRYGKNKRYAVLVEVKCSKKGYNKALLQLAKDREYYKQLYKLDKVYCIFAYGEKNDKEWNKINYKWIPDRTIEKILLR